MNDFSQFKEYVLYPALWDNIDKAFPEMDFKFIGGYWRSPKHKDGSESRSNSKDQTFIHFKRKDLIKDNAEPKADSLIDFEMSRSGSDFITALKRLAEVCNLELPDSNSEEFQEYERKQRDRKTSLKMFQDALFGGSDGSLEVLSYLRNSRQWSDEEIKISELGYIDGQVLRSIPESVRQDLDYKKPCEDKETGKRVTLQIGETHRLVIPYWNGSRLLGFKFRDIEIRKDGLRSDEFLKGLKYLNQKGNIKGDGLLGIPLNCDDVIIVEGELDALHTKAKARLEGFDVNIAATAGGSIGDNQLKDALDRKVKRFTLLFDSDERGQSFIDPSVDKILRAGKSVFIAQLPEGKDSDEYLKSHSFKEWKEEIDRTSVSSSLWRSENIAIKYYNIQVSQNGTLTQKQREDLFLEIKTLLNDPTTCPNDREMIFNYFKNQESNLLFRVEDFRSWADQEYMRLQSQERTQAVNKASQEINTLLSSGNVSEALKVMRETSIKQSAQEKSIKFSQIFATQTPTQYESYMSEIKEGIPTGYKFQEGKFCEPFTLNSGLSFICGYRGHGKTSFINNIALNQTQYNLDEGNDKSVLYFSLEIDKRRLMCDLLNTFVNDPDISRSPSATIQGYFKGAGSRFFKEGNFENPDGSRESHFNHFLRKKDFFLREYLSNGRLILIDENFKAEELLEAIKYYLGRNRASLVCIDYAQLLYSQEYTRQRTEEIKKIVNDCKDFANKEEIPFLMAGQFNREVDSPISVDTKNIGEGGDFERIADTCVGVFNLKELKPLPKNTQEEKECINLLNRLDPELNLTSLHPIQNKMFVRLMKRRYGYYPIDTILDWEGSTKTITPNDPESLKPTDKQVSIDFDQCPY